MKSLLRLLRNPRPKPVRPRRIAGVLATKNYADTSAVFETLRDLCDLTIVLDDNSTSPFPHKDECTEYIQLRHGEQWNAPANLTLLLYRAFVHGCEWVVSLDDDIILSPGFRSRRDVDDVIDRMEAEKLDFCHFRLRDLWNSEREVRVDGIWSQKTFPVVRRNWFFYDGVTLRDSALRLHTPAFPTGIRSRGIIHPTHMAYHTGCLTPEMRKARVEKYRLEDPENTFQSDYSYMLDDRAFKVEPVPPADLKLIRRKMQSRE